MSEEWPPERAWLELTSDERRRILTDDEADPAYMQDWTPDERRKFRVAVEDVVRDWQAFAPRRVHGHPRVNYHAGRVRLAEKSNCANDSDR